MLQKAIVLFLSFSLVFGDVIPRENADDLMGNTAITKIPYGFYKEKMEKGTYKVVDKEDLSVYPLKRIFAGYGVFDLQEKTCKYVENNDNKQYFTSDFEKINVFNNNTFAISRAKMTYSQCSSMVNKYIGEVYTPNSITEESAVSRGYFLEDSAWVGMQRADCNSDYINDSGIKQGYENFLYKAEPCSETKANVVKIANSTNWLRRNASEYHKCVIRIKTNDYLKPIKICAPWWRIESTFLNKNEESLLWGGRKISFENFLMPDVPTRINVCTQKKAEEPVVSSATKKVSCKKYYSRFAGGGRSGQCLEEPIQPSCEVNECSGYIENNCRKLELLDSFKDYTWGYITKNGVNTRVKIYDKIQTFMYECPAVNPNESNCIKREELVIFPKECPGSQCEELRHCIQSNAHTITYCKTTYPCEKVYGDSDLTPVYDGTGVIKSLRAKCLDGTIIENDQIREQTYSKTDCLKYDETEETNTTTKKCISVKTKSNYMVDASITEADIYADDPDCVRTNNIEDSRPYVDAVFDYTNRGFFTTVIEKAYISGENNSTEDAPDPINQLPYQIGNLQSQGFTAEPQVGSGDSGVVTQQECDAYFNSDGWYQTRIANLYSDPAIFPLGVIQSTSSANLNPVATVVKASYCPDAANALGYLDITDTVSFTDYNFPEIGIADNVALRENNISTGGRVCVLVDTKLSGDDIVKTVAIDANSDFMQMSTKDLVVNELQCNKFSTCLGLAISDPYADSTEVKPCLMNNIIPDEPINFDPGVGNFVDFSETSGTLATTLDGTKDMIVLQEYAQGRFGYMSNYRFQLPKNNIIMLNNKEIFPLIPNAPVNEDLTYTYSVRTLKETVKNKEPSSFTPYFETLSFGANATGGSAEVGNNFGAALVAGAASGLGIALVLGAVAGTGIGIVVAVVIALLAGSKRFGTIRTHWDISKHLPTTTHFAFNPYGYDFRLFDPDTRDFTYEKTRFQMAMTEKGDFERILKDYYNLKQTTLYFSGYTKEQITGTLITSCERDACVGYPGKIKWYKFSGKKSETGSNGGSHIIQKSINTVYMGAVNTVVVFVPYAGDYEMVALDKNKNILGSKIITQQDFIDSDPYKHPFAKVMFSLSSSFGLAEDISSGTIDNACLYDDFVEWGGGVSGVYYENTTPNGHKCAKSNDDWVKDKSAYYIKFKAVDSSKYFEVKLKKPMPFANRFYFVNLQKLEKRTYECYKSKEPCLP